MGWQSPAGAFIVKCDMGWLRDLRMHLTTLLQGFEHAGMSAEDANLVCPFGCFRSSDIL